MSILKSTNSGILSMPLTPETAQALGWKIERVSEQKGKYGNDYKCIDMGRDDICAPVRFWYEPHNVFKYCRGQLYFFADDEFGIDSTSSRDRCITNNKELVEYLDFLKQAKEIENSMKKLWKKKIKHLKDPKEQYYDSYSVTYDNFDD